MTPPSVVSNSKHSLSLRWVSVLVLLIAVYQAYTGRIPLLNFWSSTPPAPNAPPQEAPSLPPYPKVNVTKPAHCRPDMPGCVPKRIDYVFLLHIPKAAGTTLHLYMENNFDLHANYGGFKSIKCEAQDPAAGQMQEYHCPGRRGWTSNAEGRIKLCESQRRAVELKGHNWFKELNCTFFPGHYDMSLYFKLEPEVRERTLVLATMRQPQDVIVSLYHYLNRARRVIAKINNQTDADADMRCSLDEWIMGEAGSGIDFNNFSTKMYAGDYCCFNEGPPIYDPEERLVKALENLESVIGAVVVQERAAACMEYLSYLLGWEIPNTDFNENVGNDYKKRTELPHHLQKELKRLTSTDMRLFAATMDRAEQQIELYESSRFVTLPPWEED